MEQYWDKSPGKEEKTQRSLHLEQWLRSTRLGVMSGAYVSITTRWRHHGDIIQEHMMLQVCAPVRLCPLRPSCKIFYVLSPQVMWLPTHMPGFLYTFFLNWMSIGRSQTIESFLKDRLEFQGLLFSSVSSLLS